VRQNITTINRSGKHLLALINDVLEIARIEAGRTVIKSEPFDLDESIEMVEEMIRGRSEARALYFNLEREGELPRFAVGDGHRLRQVLLNLLGNAVKYTDHGGMTLKVTALPENKIRFEVADTGDGISPDDQQRIFQAFYQTLDGAARQEGAGLGLAISQEYVQLMGGELQVESRIGMGSRFSFTLPLPAATGSLPARVTPRRVAGLLPGQPVPRLLVVEDQLESQRLLVNLLELTGFDVRAAADGDAAIELFQEWHPALIWMDMRLPVTDGYEATRRIRALPGGKEVKIVAVTASAFEENRDAILNAGCDDILPKPVDERRLFDLMEKLLGVRYRSEEIPVDHDAQAAIDRAEFAGVDPGLLKELHCAAESLDQERVRRVIGTIGGSKPTLAEALDRLAHDFRFDKLLWLCEQQARQHLAGQRE